MGAHGRSLARQLKERLKPAYFGGQRLIARALWAYGPDALESGVRSLGIGAGDNVLVHSAFRRASGFSGTASDVIESLLKVVGPDGHLLMMSMPYRGSSQRYADGDPLFDVRRTPSAMGLISEVFRRRPDVVRSLSPLHPVLAHGPLAAWFTADHDTSPYSCGKGSPFERFLNTGGTCLFFDAPYGALTFMHYVEDCFRAQLPVPLYEPQAVAIRVRDAWGRERTVRQCVFSTAARGRRNFAPIQQALLREGMMRTARAGQTRMLSVRARSVVECAGRLLEEGPGFYT
jgi:aminoglycoside 3-N-acetyltransferase